MQNDVAQKRRFARHMLSVAVQVRRRFPHEGEIIPGLMMEIGEGGFSTMLADALRPDEMVEARFELPGVGNIAVEAIVRSKNLFRYGFELVNLEGRTRDEIRHACKSLPQYEGGWY